RFISADPYIQYPFWGQGLNRYSYGFNNPMSGSDPTGFSWLSDILNGNSSSGWEGSSYFGAALGVVGGAYITSLAQAGAFAQGGSLSGFTATSGLGGGAAIVEAFAGLNDPGAETYAAPTGQLSQGGMYNENAGAAPPRAEGALASNDEWCAGKWTEQGCSYDPYDVFGGLPVLPSFGDVARGVQAAWAWAFGPPSYASLQAAVGSLERAKVVQAVVRGEGSLGSLSAAERQAAAHFYRQAATRVGGKFAEAARGLNIDRARYLEGSLKEAPGRLYEWMAKHGY